jgi:hypothetical protein
MTGTMAEPGDRRSGRRRVMAVSPRDRVVNRPPTDLMVLPVFSDLAMPRRLKLVRSKAFPGGSAAQIYPPG